MIFISYSHKDKEVVAPIAETIRKTFGDEKVFFDQWSIQPGDFFLEKMEGGLASFRYFFFFMSKNSLSSQMVGLEWRNALMKVVKGEATLIPVKLDDCLIPNILMQNLYINLYGCGIEFAVRQIIDVVLGKNTYKPEDVRVFQNIRAYISGADRQMTIEFRAELYAEPHSKYLILIDNNEDEVSCEAPNVGVFEHCFHKDVPLSNETTVNAIEISKSEATSPGFPFIVVLSASGENPILFRGVRRAKSTRSFVKIPTIDNHTD